jgi:hypothetical protein
MTPYRTPNRVPLLWGPPPASTGWVPVPTTRPLLKLEHRPDPPPSLLHVPPRSDPHPFLSLHWLKATPTAIRVPFSAATPLCALPFSMEHLATSPSSPRLRLISSEHPTPPHSSGLDRVAIITTTSGELYPPATNALIDPRIMTASCPQCRRSPSKPLPTTAYHWPPSNVATPPYHWCPTGQWAPLPLSMSSASATPLWCMPTRLHRPSQVEPLAAAVPPCEPDARWPPHARTLLRRPAWAAWATSTAGLSQSCWATGHFERNGIHRFLIFPK